jgi:hypothetical protein
VAQYGDERTIIEKTIPLVEQAGGSSGIPMSVRLPTKGKFDASALQNFGHMFMDRARGQVSLAREPHPGIENDLDPFARRTSAYA